MSKIIVLSLGVLIGLLILLSTAAAPLVESNTADPETFEIAGKMCIYYKGQLDCDCACGTGGCSEASVFTIPETRVITVPQPIVVTVQFAPAVEGALAPVGSTGPGGDANGAPVYWDPYNPISGVEPTPGQEWNPVGLPVLEPGQSESPGNGDHSGNGPDPDKQWCNQGVGNGYEGCDPGNSNNNQQSNDEPWPPPDGDHGVPGAPGRAHNDNGGGNSDNNGQGNNGNNGRNSGD